MDEEEKKNDERVLPAPDSDHYGSKKEKSKRSFGFLSFLKRSDAESIQPTTNPWGESPPTQQVQSPSQESVTSEQADAAATDVDRRVPSGFWDPPRIDISGEVPSSSLPDTDEIPPAEDLAPPEMVEKPTHDPHRDEPLPLPDTPDDTHAEGSPSSSDTDEVPPAEDLVPPEMVVTSSESADQVPTYPPEGRVPFQREDPVSAAPTEMQTPERRSLLSVFRKKTGPLKVPEYDYDTIGALVSSVLLENEEEVDSYWIEKGLSLVTITYNTVRRLKEYHLSEPALTPFEYELLERVYEDLRDILILTDTEIREKPELLLFRKTEDLLIQYGLKLEPETMYKLRYYLKRNFLGWSRIDPLMKDLEIEDISCDGHNIPIFLYHRKHRNIRTNIQFPEQQLNSLAISLAQRSGKHISIGSPILDATLPEGSRLQLTLGTEVTSRGSSFTIRKFRPEPFTPIELMEKGTFSVDQLVYFWLAIENNKSLLYIGGTASGKTSSLNAMSLFIPPLAKVVSIEDTREIMLYRENWIASVTRESVTSEGSRSINMFDLLKAAMRQRPEYIIVGEVRGPEAQTLFQAMNTGHTTYSTMHAGGVDATIHRLESEPLNVPRNMLQALNIISVQGMIFRGTERVRRCQEIVEITGIEPNSGNVLVNNVFEYDPVTDEMRYSGRSHVYSAIAANRGWSREEISAEVQRRRQVILALHEQDIRDFKSVSEIFSVFAITPDVIFNNIDDLARVLT